MDDFCSISGDFVERHLVAPRGKLYVSQESSLKRPLKYIDVNRHTKTNLDFTLGGKQR